MLKAYSVQKLNRISKGKKIWCFGCGKRLNDILRLYSKEPFVKKIAVLIDSNRLLWGKIKKVEGNEILVSSPALIQSKKNEKIFILITSDNYQEIYRSISDDLIGTEIGCSRYPACYYTYTAVLSAMCVCLPLRRQMLFNAGEEPHENAKAMVEYLAEKYKGKKYRIIFIDDGQKTNERMSDVIYIERNSLKCKNALKCNLKYCFYMTTSKYIFYENEPLEKRRKGQVLIYLNHGTIPLKNVADVLKQPAEMDFAICPSKGCADIYRQQYNIPPQKLIYAMPPRDMFLKRERCGLNRLIDCEDKQVIIWLPTFRALRGTDRKDSSENVLSLITNEREIKLTNERLRKNGQILLIKCHPREKQRANISQSYECIKIITDENLKRVSMVLHEILGGTAALLTDYSGISFEYMLLDRPIGYVINDMEQYTRGFAFPNPRYYMPGKTIQTGTGLREFLDEVKGGKDDFRDRRKQLIKELFQGNEVKDGSQELIKTLENYDKYTE